MKFCSLAAFIVGLVIIAAADDIKQETKDRIQKFHNECQVDPETKVDEAIIEKHLKDEPIDESQFAKHILCMNVKSGIQKENGDVDKDGLKKLIIADTDKVDEIVEDCGERNGITAEESALALLKCLKKHIPRREHHD
ncbi:unnamed protein product [Phaedon cochleariae]|uniref:Uncharacterized protein n=1 Tax=Phaedon cochleariae TaxID=80249 RepID=A0A9P0DPL4_PHACE|nr:unnamed protein product [Phaedon cochleariae]